MDGWQTVAALKENPQTRTIPVVIVSSLSPTQSEVPTPDDVEWIRKPLDTASLFRTLDRALSQSTQAPKVLVVEDDPDLAQVLTAMFQRHGIETYCAQTGREAIEISQRLTPDLLVLDLILPQGDGFSVVKWYQQQERLQGVSLVVYSARDLDESDRQRLQLGQAEYLTKGRISPAEFEERVVTLLNRILLGQARSLAGNGGVDRER